MGHLDGTISRALSLAHSLEFGVGHLKRRAIPGCDDVYVRKLSEPELQEITDLHAEAELVAHPITR